MKKTLVIVILILMVSVLSFGQEKEEVISLLNNIDISSTKYNNEIIFIEEFNFGIPGGINWLVQWYNENKNHPAGPQIYLMIYVVDTNKREIIFMDQIGLFDTSIPTLVVSYYRNLPGVTIGDWHCQIGDFNGDGFDEILQLGIGHAGPVLSIRGYDSQTSKIKRYCSIPHSHVENESEPPPVEFISYKGMEGFKLLYFVNEVAGGPGWVPDPSPNNGRWFFYTWDKIRMEFVRVEEVEEDGIESVWPVTVKQDTGEQMGNIFTHGTIELPSAETSAFTSVASGKNTQSRFYIVIIAAVALAAAVFIVVKKRKS